MTERCPFCGQTSGVIWVRAHYQCASCGQVVVPCCNGETASTCTLEAGSPIERLSRSVRDPNSSDDSSERGT